MAQTFTLGGGVTVTASADITPQNVPVACTVTNSGPDTIDLLALAPSEVLARTIPPGQQAEIPAPPQGQTWQMAAATSRQMRQGMNIIGWVSTGLTAVGAIGGWELGKYLGRKLRHK